MKREPTADDIQAHALGVRSDELSELEREAISLGYHPPAKAGSLEWHQAQITLWMKATEGWCRDANCWFRRYESMRRGSIILMTALVADTVLMVSLLWIILIAR